MVRNLICGVRKRVDVSCVLSLSCWKMKAYKTPHPCNGKVCMDVSYLSYVNIIECFFIQKDSVQKCGISSVIA